MPCRSLCYKFPITKLTFNSIVLHLHWCNITTFAIWYSSSELLRPNFPLLIKLLTVVICMLRLNTLKYLWMLFSYDSLLLSIELIPFFNEHFLAYTGMLLKWLRWKSPTAKLALCPIISFFYLISHNSKKSYNHIRITFFWCLKQVFLELF